MRQGIRTERGWLEMVRTAMHEATLDEAEARFGTRQPAYNYRWEHVCAVHTLAMKLAELTGADAEIVEAAVWLHDIRKDVGREHPLEGAVFARGFLEKTDFPADKIERVAQAIADHMGLWRDEPLQALESQVLWDADKLVKLGLTAAVHWMGIEFAKSIPLTTEALIEKVDVGDENWQEKTVASMHTGPARRAAKKRLATFRQVWETLQGELAGEDLQEGG